MAMIFLLSGWMTGQVLPLPDDFILVAHRGVVSDTATENSLEALEGTIRRGYTHVEVDVRVTKDGHAVCHHDRSLQRTLGIDRNVDELTLAELRELVPQDVLPSFETFCAKAEGRINLMLDVKSIPAALKEPFVNSLDISLVKHKLLEHALFIGRTDIGKHFYGRAKLAWRAPLERARKTERARNHPGDYYFIFNHAADFDKKTVDGFHAMGLKVIVSINLFHYPEGDPVAQGRADIKRMLALGVDGLQIDAEYDPLILGEH